MGLSSKQFANNPVINARTLTVELAATNGAPASLIAAINTAAGITVTNITGILFSASKHQACYIGGAAAGEGVLVDSGQNLFLPYEGGDVLYETGAQGASCMIFRG